MRSENALWNINYAKEFKKLAELMRFDKFLCQINLDRVEQISIAVSSTLELLRNITEADNFPHKKMFVLGHFWILGQNFLTKYPTIGTS